MEKLNCFVSEFSLVPLRLIFQHRSEIPKEKPAEHHEISKEEAGKIAKGIKDIVNNMEKHELKGYIDKPSDEEFKYQKGNFNYRIFCKYITGGRFEIGVSKDSKDFKYLGTIYILASFSNEEDFSLKMTYSAANYDETRGGITQVASAQFNVDGQYCDNNGRLLKEKADEYMKILNDYIRAETSGPGSKEIRDF